ncbi:hypothetical protein PGR6_02740 [Pseudomonas sp. GR 6-02]|nr:hypothetical protein PGR6_02740 [Pseudomonas sp. GR 6-02]
MSASFQAAEKPNTAAPFNGQSALSYMLHLDSNWRQSTLVLPTNSPEQTDP